MIEIRLNLNPIGLGLFTWLILIQRKIWGSTWSASLSMELL
jgi:hypothetical protein